MTDDRLSRGLRAVEGVYEPRTVFAEELHSVLAAKLGFDVPAARALVPPRPASSTWRRLILLAATVALTLALVGGALVGGALVKRLARPPTLLESVRAAGALRIAVRPDHPQALVPEGSLDGFDVDVADELAARLGVRSDLVVAPFDEMFVGDTMARWDVALPSAALPSGIAEQLLFSDPYYHWPVYLLVPVSSSATDVEDLAGATVCVVAGSAGELWADEADEARVDERTAPPAGAAVRSLADDAACLADVSAGGSDAAVTSTTVAADIATLGDYRVVGGGPVASEPRAVVVSADEPGADTLVVALDEALAGLHSDGTLAMLSERRFGGVDLSVPVTE